MILMEFFSEFFFFLFSICYSTRCVLNYGQNLFKALSSCGLNSIFVVDCRLFGWGMGS